MSESRTYLSAEELKGCIPHNKKTLRDITWDRRFVNYFIGVRPPDNELWKNLGGDVYWYDLAEDVVKRLVVDTDKKTASWSAQAAAEKNVPRYVIREKDSSLVGRVDEKADAQTRATSLKDFLHSEDDI